MGKAVEPYRTALEQEQENQQVERLRKSPAQRRQRSLRRADGHLQELRLGKQQRHQPNNLRTHRNIHYPSSTRENTPARGWAA